MSGVLWVITFLAIWRATRLITADYLTEPLRARMSRTRHGAARPKIAYLFECPWCLSMWIAPLFVVPVVYWPDSRVTWVVIGCFAASGVSGLLATVENRLDR